jgi:hypothetical protein
MMGLILAELKSRREAPMPSASDFGGQAVDMMRALDHLEKLKNHFAPAADDDGEDGEGGLMGMLSQLLPLLMPGAAVAAPAIAAPPVAGRIGPPPVLAAAQRVEDAADGLQRWAASPLNAEEVANVEQTLAVVGRWAPSITMRFLVEAGAAAGCTPRQAVFMFQKVFLEFIPGGGAAAEDEGEEWSEGDEEWSEEGPEDYEPGQPAGAPPQAQGATGQPAVPDPQTSPGLPLNGPPSMPASHPTASGPSDSSPK